MAMANRLVLGISMGVVLLFFAGLGSLLDTAGVATTALMSVR